MNAGRLLAFAELVRDFFTDDASGHAAYLKEQAVNAIAQAQQTPPEQKQLVSMLEETLDFIDAAVVRIDIAEAEGEIMFGGWCADARARAAAMRDQLKKIGGAA